MPRKPYKGQERRSGRDRRRGPDRRKWQEKPVEGKYRRVIGKGLASLYDFYPPTIHVPNERREKDRRKGKDRRKN